MEGGGAALVAIAGASVVPKGVGVKVEVEEIVMVEAVVPASRAFKYSRKTMQLWNPSVQ